MLRFQHPDLFWLLLLSILLLVFFLYQNQQRIKAIRLFGDEKLVNALMPRFSQPLRLIKFGLLLLAFIIGIINGYIYIKTRDIIKISLVHISLNTISSLITCYNNLIFILGIILMIEVILYFGKERYL